MDIGRRELMTGAAAAMVTIGTAGMSAQGAGQMYGLIGKMTTVSGQRDAFIAILLEGVGEMPGCLSYVVAKDPANADAIWITEVWDSQASHDASLKMPAVRAAIAKGRPLIAGFDPQTITTPVGGYGLPKVPAPAP
jgi:quinol monooxygenase YgiN